MPFIQLQEPQAAKATCDRILKAFIEFCRQEFGYELYDYQVRIAAACFDGIFVSKKDVAIAISRQSGKTECVTLILRFLLIFYKLFTGAPLMCGLASSNGEQAKTSVDRIKKSVTQLRNRWQVEDREFNSQTVRAYRFDQLSAAIFKFSLAPTTHNESKSLNLLIVDEAHLADDQKRSNELDPMLANAGGITIFIGVGCTRLCDFYKAKNGQMSECSLILVPVDEVIRDRRKQFEKTGDPKHLEYEKAFERELRKKGSSNPELRRNYYLEDQVEQGNFIARDRLVSCARGPGVVVPTDQLYVGIDWARSGDSTWLTVTNNKFDVIDWFKYPHIPYVQQVELMVQDLKAKGYTDKIVSVRGDDTGTGGPMEILQQGSGLPVGQDSFFKFTLQSKDQLYVLFEQALFRDAGQDGRFSYPGDHPLAAEFEDQMTCLLREYKGDGEYLSVHHPDEPGAHDDAPDATALALLAGQSGGIGNIIF